MTPARAPLTAGVVARGLLRTNDDSRFHHRLRFVHRRHVRRGVRAGESTVEYVTQGIVLLCIVVIGYWLVTDKD